MTLDKPVPPTPLESFILNVSYPLNHTKYCDKTEDELRDKVNKCVPDNYHVHKITGTRVMNITQDGESSFEDTKLLLVNAIIVPKTWQMRGDRFNLGAPEILEVPSNYLRFGTMVLPNTLKTTFDPLPHQQQKDGVYAFYRKGDNFHQIEYYEESSTPKTPKTDFSLIRRFLVKRHNRYLYVPDVIKSDMTYWLNSSEEANKFEFVSDSLLELGVRFEHLINYLVMYVNLKQCYGLVTIRYFSESKFYKSVLSEATTYTGQLMKKMKLFVDGENCFRQMLIKVYQASDEEVSAMMDILNATLSD